MPKEYKEDRKPQDLSPWEEEGSPWKTEAAYWSWVRSGLRKTLWSKYPIKNSFLLKMRFKAPLGKNEKMIFCAKCAKCNETFKTGELVVDHVIPNPPLRQSITEYLKSLHANHAGMQLMCDPCHAIKTIMDREKCTEKEAVFIQKCAAFKKLKAGEQYEYLRERGCAHKHLNNNVQRLIAFKTLPTHKQS